VSAIRTQESVEATGPESAKDRHRLGQPSRGAGSALDPLNPDHFIRHNDVLLSTRPNLKWNHMCAGRHSTNLRNGYDRASDSYDTAFP